MLTDLTLSYESGFFINKHTKFKKNKYSFEIPIYVRCFNRKIIKLHVNRYATIYNLKQLLSTYMRNNTTKYRLIFGGKNLIENKTLDYYHIKKYSEI